MNENTTKETLYYPRKMRIGWCVAHEVTAAGVKIERYGIKCRRRAIMSEKVSILTLRLTAEEAAQMEVLKSITGKKSGSEAIKYIVKEYPRFCAHYKQEAREKGELQRKYQDQKIAVGDFLKAFERLQQTMEDDRK